MADVELRRPEDGTLIVESPPQNARRIRIFRERMPGRTRMPGFVVNNKQELDDLIKVLQNLSKEWKD